MVLRLSAVVPVPARGAALTILPCPSPTQKWERCVHGGLGPALRLLAGAGASSVTPCQHKCGRPPVIPCRPRFYGHDWHLRLFAEGRGHTRSCQLPASSDPLWDTVNLPVGGSRGCSGHGAVVHIVSDGGVQPGTWPGPVPTGAKMGLAARDHEQHLGKRCCV